MKHRPVFSGFFITLVLGLMLAGCSGPSVPGRERQAVGDGLLARTSPENVLWNLRMIYGEKDGFLNTVEDAHYWAEKYRELFHPDSSVFKFYFVPGDAPSGFSDGWWGIEDEVASFEGLLGAVISGQVENVELAWTVNPSEPDSRVDPNSGELLHPSWRHIRVTSYLLDVQVGENIYRAMGMADFYFGSDPYTHEFWVITEWWDGAIRFSARGSDVDSEVTEPFNSWGRLKGLFY